MNRRDGVNKQKHSTLFLKILTKDNSYCTDSNRRNYVLIVKANLLLVDHKLIAVVVQTTASAKGLHVSKQRRTSNRK